VLAIKQAKAAWRQVKDDLHQQVHEERNLAHKARSTKENQGRRAAQQAHRDTQGLRQATQRKNREAQEVQQRERRRARP
jgi:hypothetical protein